MGTEFDFAATYARMADEQLVALREEREDLQPAAVAALEAELQRRGISGPLPTPAEPEEIADPRSPAELAGGYAGMFDEELLRLDAQRDTLVDPAVKALDAELDRRNLRASKPIPAWGAWKTGARDEPPTPSLRENAKRAHWFYIEALRLCHIHFWLFAAIAAPLGLTSYGLWTLRLFVTEEFARDFVYREGVPDFTTLYLSSVLVVVLSWFLTCLGFGAIALAVEGLQRGERATLRHCISSVRSRAGAVLKGAVVLGACVAVGLAAFSFVAVTFGMNFGRVVPAGVLHALSWLMFALVSGALARYAFVLPATVLHRVPALSAPRISNRLTDGYAFRIWLAFVECQIATFVIGMVAWRFLAPLSWEISPALFHAFEATLAALYAVLQVPLLIGITLLYLESFSHSNEKAAEHRSGM